MSENSLTLETIGSLRMPMTGTFELTHRCNLNCKMCLFRHSDAETSSLIEKELSAEQWERIAAQAAEAGTVSLLLTGGEAMLRADFPEVYERIYRQGFYLTLYTNATMVTPRVMEVLQKYPPHKIGVTIYGASEKTYEETCGDGKAFYRMLDGIDQLRTLPSEMEYRTTVICTNYDDLPLMEELVRKKYDGKLTHTEVVFPAIRGGANHPEQYRLSPEKMAGLNSERFCRSLEKLKDKGLVSEKDLRWNEIEPEPAETAADSVLDFDRLTLFGCAAGITEYTVSWDGKLLPCQLLGTVAVDMLEKDFASAWEELPFRVERVAVPERCETCAYGSRCSNCVAVRIAENGNLSECPEYECQLTKARIEEEKNLRRKLGL